MTEFKSGSVILKNCCCMEYMRTLPDKAFDLAICDPPYGIGDALVIGGTWSKKYQKKGAKWDVKPEKSYFEELFRVSKNWIIWGANNYSEHIPSARCFLVWQKPNMSGMHTMADGELALTSFDSNAKIYSLTSQQNEQRIHVCQKPVKLYEWLLQNYAKQGDKILDTHLGSGSSAIAAHYGGFDFVGCELDADYYKAAVERFNYSTSQIAMF